MTHKIYLDTSFCRAAGRSLKNLTLEVQKTAPSVQVCTSMLTLIELLPDADTTDQDYARRRSAIASIHDAGIEIIWRMPEAVFVNTFSVLRDTYALTENRDLWVGELVRIVLRSETASDYRAALSDSRLAQRLRVLRDYDNNFAARLAQITQEGNKQAREEFEQTTPEERRHAESLGLVRYTGDRFAEFVKSMIDTGATLAFGRIGLVQLALRLCRLDELDEQLQDKVDDSFNGAALLFLHALTALLDADLQNGSHPGRNDALDISHFLYLSPGDVLASTDKKMAAIAKTLPVRVMDAGALPHIRGRNPPTAPAGSATNSETDPT